MYRDTAVLVLVFMLVMFTERATGVCCDGLGCFDNSPPNTFLLPPNCPDICQLNYTLYTRSNPDYGQKVSNVTVPSVYSGSRRTVFIVHGWLDNGTKPWLTEMKHAFILREDINVVIVDWSKCANNSYNYLQSASDTQTVGAQTALVIQNLLTVPESDSSLMWCAGHSLGAHVCGHAGMRMPSGSELGQVTGMDPDGPIFETEPDVRIGVNPSCATLVDITHTDGVLGTRRPLGHMDWYIGIGFRSKVESWIPAGYSQPGCTLTVLPFNLTDVTNQNVQELEAYFTSAEYAADVACSHSRAHEYMTASINNDCFLSYHYCTDYNLVTPASCTLCTDCSPCAIMGYSADKSCKKNGIFYLNVTDTAPYCVG